MKKQKQEKTLTTLQAWGVVAVSLLILALSVSIAIADGKIGIVTGYHLGRLVTPKVVYHVTEIQEDKVLFSVDEMRMTTVFDGEDWQYMAVWGVNASYSRHIDERIMFRVWDDGARQDAILTDAEATIRFFPELGSITRHVQFVLVAKDGSMRESNVITIDVPSFEEAEVLFALQH